MRFGSSPVSGAPLHDAWRVCRELSDAANNATARTLRLLEINTNGVCVDCGEPIAAHRGEWGRVTLICPEAS